jgi:hypothetical protein
MIELQPKIVGTFLLNSKCALEVKEKNYLYKLMNYRPLNAIILYRGSEHGWKRKDFHSRCDNKGPTICLFKIKNGDCIGGYTNALWSSETKFICDSESMLFNLSCCRCFPSKRS